MAARIARRKLHDDVAAGAARGVRQRRFARRAVVERDVDDQLVGAGAAAAQGQRHEHAAVGARVVDRAAGAGERRRQRRQRDYSQHTVLALLNWIDVPPSVGDGVQPPPSLVN